MENIEAVVKKRLRPFYISYVAAVIVCLVVLSGSVLISRYVSSLASTAERLRSLHISLAGMDNTIGSMDKILFDAGRNIPGDIITSRSQRYLHMGLDSVKRYAGGNAEVNLTALEDSGNEMRQGLSIRGSIPDYHQFLMNIGYLQGMAFPFFTMNSLSISAAKTDAPETTVIYEINGFLTMPKQDITRAARERQGKATRN